MTTIRIFFNGTVPYDVDSDLIDLAKMYLQHECMSKMTVIKLFHESGFISAELATAIVSEAERQLSSHNPAQS